MAKANRKKNYNLGDAFTDRLGNVYDKEVSNALTMWLGMTSGANGPTDKGPHGLTATAPNTPVYREARIGNKTLPFISSSDANNINVQVTSPLLSFSSLPDGGTPTDGTDRPFTISCWINLDQIAGQPHGIFGKNSKTIGTGIAYDAHIDSDGKIQFQIGETEGGLATRGVKTPASAVAAGRWYHVACTYDGRGGSNAQNGMEIYVNAVSQSCDTVTPAGSYNGMQPRHSNPLYVGARYTGDAELDGKIAEFSVFKHKLSNENVNAIYNATREGGFQLISGYLDNPPRTRLIDADNKMGAYPTVARTGDKDALGKSKSFFDDTQTVNFYGSFATAKITFYDLPKNGQQIKLGWGFDDSLNQPYPNTQLHYTFANGNKVLLPKLGFASSLQEESKNNTRVVQVVNIKAAHEMAKSAKIAAVTFQPPGVSVDQNPPTFDHALEIIAAKFAEAVNEARTNTVQNRASRMIARVEGATVHLRIEIPMRGMFDYRDPGGASGELRRNIITTSSFPTRLVKNDKGQSVPTAKVPATIVQFFQHGPNVYQYPFMTPLTSSAIDARIATPNIRTNITGAALMTKGVSDIDAYNTPTRFETITPFDECRLALDNDSLFDQEGTPESVIPGFSARLASKTVLRWPINTKRTETVNWTTGSVTGTVGVKSGLVYYNWNIGQWEDPADVSTGSNVDYYHWRRKHSTGSYLATIPSTMYAQNLFGFDAKELQPHVGLPTNYAGFPLASKFDATGSQLRDLSGSITAPFVLEKVRLKFSGAISTLPASRGTDQAQSSTFMLILERPGKMTRITGSYTVESADMNDTDTPRVIPITEHQSTFHQARDRRVIWVGRIGQFRKDEDNSGAWNSRVDLRQRDPRVFEACDTWLPVTGTSGGETNAIYSTTGSFVVEAAVKSIAKLKRCSPFVQPRNSNPTYKAVGSRATEGVANHMLFGTQGGRDLYDISDGRSLIAGVAAANASGTLGQTAYYSWKVGAPWVKSGLINDGPTMYAPSDFNSLAPGGREGAMGQVTTKLWPLVENAMSPSPFILLPGDKLILAYANQQMPKTDEANTSALWALKAQREQKVPFYHTKIAPGEAHIELYGSMVRAGKPVDPSINQQLTSPAIHEDVRDDSSPLGESNCLDQWMVEPRISYHGSYLDYYLTGTAVPQGTTLVTSGGTNQTITLTSASADPFNKEARQAVAFATEGNITPSGSLTRHEGKQERSRWWGKRNSIQRFVRLPSHNEIYYDSTLPKFDLYISACNINTFKIPTYGNFVTLFNHLEQSENDIQIAAYGKGGPKFMRSFPFEPKFGPERLTRVRTPEQALQTIDGATNTQARAVDRIYYIVGDQQFQYLTNPWQDPNSSFHPAIASKITDSTIVKALYGFGKGWVGSGSQFYGIPTHGHAEGSSTISFLRISGFKYGLINAVPQNTSAVYRPDTYGQFRDMLEQRQYTRLYQDQIDDSGAITIEKDLEEAVIQVSFRAREEPDKDAKPAATNSQNLSVFYTSSVPYFDGVTKDRFDIQPDMSASFKNE